MYIAKEDIEKVKKQNNFFEILKKYTNLNKINNLYIGINPFNKEDNTFIYDSDKDIYYSLIEGYGGDIFSFFMRLKNISFIDAYLYLSKEKIISINEKYNKDREILLKINKKTYEIYKENLKKELISNNLVKEYIKERNLDKETLEKFGIGFSGIDYKYLYEQLKKDFSIEEIQKSDLVGFYDNENHKNKYIKDKFINRLIFPIKNEKEVIVGFGGRTLLEKSKKNPKYINSSESIIYDKSSIIYGLDIAKKSKKNYFIICEGYLDVITLHKFGFDNAIAPLGTAFTKNHAKLIKKYKNKVYLSFDSDNAGINATKKAYNILNSFNIDTKIINLYPYKDPDEFLNNLDKSILENRIEKAIDYEKFEIIN